MVEVHLGIDSIKVGYVCMYGGLVRRNNGDLIADFYETVGSRLADS